ncbi:MAG TPA: hypothetical protein VGI75_00145 [Pirellulales bacterium]
MTSIHESISEPGQLSASEERTSAQSPSIVAKIPRQPTPSVAELSAKLYAAYTVDDGTLRLAGCELQPRPILHRFVQSNSTSIANKILPTTAIAEIISSPSVTVRTRQQSEQFVTLAGQPLDVAAIADLDLNDLVKLDKPPRISSDDALRIADLVQPAADSNGSTSIVEIVWCRFASGKLRFTIGEQFVDLAFADWAARLAPQPFVCPHSGRSTYHLAAIDDGRIVAAEAVGICELTKQRMLQNDLVTCSITGKKVAAEFTEVCAATGQPVLRAEMVECPTCRNRVSPHAIARNRCRICREPPALIKTDSRIAPVFVAHPSLNRWHHWKMATGPQTYMLEACSLLRQLLVVLDKQTLEPLRMAGKSRLQRSWIDIPQAKWLEILA